MAASSLSAEWGGVGLGDGVWSMCSSSWLLQGSALQLLVEPSSPRNAPMPFCHEGEGQSLTGFPPTCLAFFPFPEDEGEVTLRDGASCFRGAFATTARGSARYETAGERYSELYLFLSPPRQSSFLPSYVPYYFLRAQLTSLAPRLQ